jgi:hypothetical protein
MQIFEVMQLNVPCEDPLKSNEICGTDLALRRYDMNGIFQMQGGKNRFLPK